MMFIIPNLGGGGAERTFLNICTYLDRGSFEPVLVMGEKKGPYCSQIPSDILTISMDELHMRRCMAKLASTIRIIKPDILCSTLTHMNIVSIAAHSMSRSSSRIVVREASVYNEASTQMSKGRRKLLDYMVRRSYARADAIVFLTEGASWDFVETFTSIDVSKRKVIHNPVDIEYISELKEEPIYTNWWPSSKRKIVAVGRLTAAKGYSYLLEAMLTVSQVLPDTCLIVMGSGEEEENLRAYSKQLGVDESVIFAGFQDNPFRYIAKSDLFVLSSLWEGFANVIVEAMACGVPVVATSCPYGPREIVQHGINGILVPPGDSEALASSIIRVLTDPKLANRLGDNAVERAKDFDVMTIVGEYERLFRELVG